MSSRKKYRPRKKTDEYLDAGEAFRKKKIPGFTESINIDPKIEINDEFRLALNLIQNSLKYAVTEKKPLIEIGDKEEEDGWVHFFIRDNGPGISKGDRERIFKFYERGNSLGPVDGFGVGLAFVKKAVEMFDGKVWLETEKDKGSTFYFSIKR